MTADGPRWGGKCVRDGQRGGWSDQEQHGEGLKGTEGKSVAKGGRKNRQVGRSVARVTV